MTAMREFGADRCVFKPVWNRLQRAVYAVSIMSQGDPAMHRAMCARDFTPRAGWPFTGRGLQCKKGISSR